MSIDNLEPPPRIVDKFNSVWKDWLYYLYQRVEDIGAASGGVTDHGALTGLDDNDHGAIYYTEAEVDAKTWDASDIVSGTFADARVAESNVTNHEAAIDHTNIANIGSNTHAQIDTAITASTNHIADTDIHVNAIPGVFRDTGETNITSSAATVGLDTADINTDSSYTLSSGEITVTVGGTYCIQFSLPIDADGTTTPDRDNVSAWVELDDGGGFVAIAQSYSEAYYREGAGGTGLSGGFVAAIDTNDDIRLRIISPSITVDAGDYRTRTGQAQLSIFRIA